MHVLEVTPTNELCKRGELRFYLFMILSLPVSLLFLNIYNNNKLFAYNTKKTTSKSYYRILNVHYHIIMIIFIFRYFKH